MLGSAQPEMCMQIRIPLAYFYYFINSLSIQMKHNFLCKETSSILFLCVLWCRLSSNPWILWAVAYNEHCGPLSDRSALYPPLMRQFPNYWANRQCFSTKFHPFKHRIPTGWLANYRALNPSHTQMCGIYSWTSNFLFFPSPVQDVCFVLFFFFSNDKYLWTVIKSYPDECVYSQVICWMRSHHSASMLWSNQSVF